MTRSDARAVGSSPWSPREAELLAVTLRLLQQEGYDGLDRRRGRRRRAGQQGDRIPAVADEGGTGVRGIHRRRSSGRFPPETGTLRGDLLQLGNNILDHASTHASTMRAVLVELSHNPALNDVSSRSSSFSERP